MSMFNHFNSWHIIVRRVMFWAWTGEARPHLTVIDVQDPSDTRSARKFSTPSNIEANGLSLCLSTSHRLHPPNITTQIHYHEAQARSE